MARAAPGPRLPGGARGRDRLGERGSAAQVAAALAGGTLAAGAHFAKAGARAAINTSPEPFSNVAASLGEDSLCVGGLWLLLHKPLYFFASLAGFALLALVLIVTLWRFVRSLFRPRPATT